MHTLTICLVLLSWQPLRRSAACKSPELQVKGVKRGDHQMRTVGCRSSSLLGGCSSAFWNCPEAPLGRRHSAAACPYR